MDYNYKHVPVLVLEGTAPPTNVSLEMVKTSLKACESRIRRLHLTEPWKAEEAIAELWGLLDRISEDR
jgi:hypothetical protein